ncbi:hypothetical protein HK097_002910 [Rhizophlyctis rosea]|uniref:Uncharacterized protein n=1 Tax=Rhizophlyctis rosea TaxID=64517 RepID=A0AAD5SG75_9FUNG|nr:hypothetical protein HK097_002910 [Rhizophlyctis rosea]
MISGQQQDTSENTPGANTPQLSPPEDWKNDSQIHGQWEKQSDDQEIREHGATETSSPTTAMPTDDDRKEDTTLPDMDWAASSAALWMDAKERHDKRNEQERTEDWEGEQPEDLPLETPQSSAESTSSMNTAQSWQPFGTSEQKTFSVPFGPKSEGEEIQGLGHGLNPDAPEFAPTFDTDSSRLGLQLPHHDTQQRNAGTAASFPEQTVGWRGGPEQSRGRQTVPGGSLPAIDTTDPNLAAYMLHYGGETEAIGRKHLRRTGSEPSIAPRITNLPGEPVAQAGWPETASSRPQYGIGVNAPLQRVQQPITPGPSPRRRPSIPREQTGSESIAGEGLVVRTRALLEHQMRANLAFAESIAQEYGRELAVRVEAQRRAFVAEEGRRTQLLEMTLRRKVAEAEENIRRQFEDRDMTRVRVLEARNAELERVADDLQRTIDAQQMQMEEKEGSMDPLRLQQQYQQRAASYDWRTKELVTQIEHLRREIELRDQTIKRAQQELTRMQESNGSAEGLARAYQEEREKRLRLEQKVGGLTERTVVLEERLRDANGSDDLRKYAADLSHLAGKTPDQLRMIVIALDRERTALTHDNISMQRKMADMGADLNGKTDEANSLREQIQRRGSDGPNGRWLQGLQAEIQQLEDATRSPGSGTPGHQDRVVNVLRELEKQQSRLTNLLPEPPAWSAFDGNTDALLGGELEGGSTSGKKEKEWESSIFPQGAPITPGTPGSVASSLRGEGYFGSLASNPTVGSGRVRTKSGGGDAGGFSIDGPRIAGIVPLKDPAPGPKEDATEPAQMSFYDRFMSGSFLPAHEMKLGEAQGGVGGRESSDNSGSNNNNNNNNTSSDTFANQSDNRPFPASSSIPTTPHPSWFGSPRELKLTAFGPPPMTIPLPGPAAEPRSVGGTVTPSQQPAASPYGAVVGAGGINPQPFALAMGRNAFRPQLPEGRAQIGGGNAVGGVGVIGAGMRHGQGQGDVGADSGGVTIGLGSLGIGMPGGVGIAGGGGYGQPGGGMATHLGQGGMNVGQPGLGMMQGQAPQRQQEQSFPPRFAPFAKPAGRG